MRVLVVDDDITSACLVENFLLAAGYEVGVAHDGVEAFDLLCQGDYRIVISDWQMPRMSGLELTRRIRERHLGSYVYVILLTSLGGTQNLIEGLNAGADDFITKPFQPDELQVRLHVAERIVALETRDLVIFSMAKLAESRDPETGAHLERMRAYSRLLAEHLSETAKFGDVINADYIRTLYLTSPLHDIGKVGIPDQVLLKPGRLNEFEFHVMQQHTVIGGATLDAALQAHPTAEFLRFARDIAMSHHERFDGEGYPNRLSGEQIPLCGRIVAVADVYDALTTRRVYKPAYSHDVARSIILSGRGTQFDPDIVDAFLKREADFVEIHHQLERVSDHDTTWVMPRAYSVPEPAAEIPSHDSSTSDTVVIA